MLSLSVVIPTWVEAPLVADAVRCAARLGDEVIVADGGSPDGTADLARDTGARVVKYPKGRRPQLNGGAAAARADVLLFLHADARLAPAGRDAIFVALAEPGVAGGNFLVRFLPESRFTRVLVPFNDLRRRVTRRYYGDSGMFVRAPAFRRLGGVRPWPVMHDHEFSGRLRRLGRCAYVREPSVRASARRFEGREARTALTWAAIHLAYRLGAPPERLARLYPDVRGGGPERFVAECRRRLG
jgi:glycosyltransferase involved in cell wall biosynthesis